jgi:predicted transcriptional regulator
MAQIEPLSCASDRYSKLCRGRLDSADHLPRGASRLSKDAEQTSQALVFPGLQDAEAGRVIQARDAEDQALKSKLDRNKKNGFGSCSRAATLLKPSYRSRFPRGHKTERQP